MSRSKELFEQAKTLMPGGVNSPVRAFKSVGRDPIFIKRAKGSTITDVDGRTYIDYVGSWGPMILGHCHPQVAAALEAAVGRKLFTHFEQVPGKVAFFHRAIPADVQKLSLFFEKSIKGERGWALYSGSPSEVTAGLSTVQPLNRMKSLVEMMVWMIINAIWKPGMKFYFRTEKGIPYYLADVEYLLNQLHVHFGGYRYEPSRGDYLGERTIVRALVIPNFGLAESPGEIRRIDMILHDSWGEFRHLRMATNAALMEMAEMLSRAERAGQKVDLRISAPPSQNDPRLEREFEYSLAKTREAQEYQTIRLRKATLDLN